MEVAVVIVEKVPAGQRRQRVLSPAPTVPEYLPAPQGEHVAMLWAAKAVEKVPAGQDWQSVTEVRADKPE